MLTLCFNVYFQTASVVINLVKQLTQWTIEEDIQLYKYRGVEGLKYLYMVDDRIIIWLQKIEFPLKVQELSDLNRALLRSSDMKKLLERVVRFPDGRPRYYAGTSAAGKAAFKKAFQATFNMIPYTPEYRDHVLALHAVSENPLIFSHR
jgi:hypothetical protein